VSHRALELGVPRQEVEHARGAAAARAELGRLILESRPVQLRALAVLGKYKQVVLDYML
jgi:hypothetical protein